MSDANMAYEYGAVSSPVTDTPACGHVEGARYSTPPEHAWNHGFVQPHEFHHDSNTGICEESGSRLQKFNSIHTSSSLWTSAAGQQYQPYEAKTAGWSRCLSRDSTTSGEDLASITTGRFPEQVILPKIGYRPVGSQSGVPSRVQSAARSSQTPTSGSPPQALSLENWTAAEGLSSYSELGHEAYSSNDPENDREKTTTTLYYPPNYDADMDISDPYETGGSGVSTTRPTTTRGVIEDGAMNDANDVATIGTSATSPTVMDDHSEGMEVSTSFDREPDTTGPFESSSQLILDQTHPAPTHNFTFSEESHPMQVYPAMDESRPNLSSFEPQSATLGTISSLGVTPEPTTGMAMETGDLGITTQDNSMQFQSVPVKKLSFTNAAPLAPFETPFHVFFDPTKDSVALSYQSACTFVHDHTAGTTIEHGIAGNSYNEQLSAVVVTNPTVISSHDPAYSLTALMAPPPPPSQDSDNLVLDPVNPLPIDFQSLSAQYYSQMTAAGDDYENTDLDFDSYLIEDFERNLDFCNFIREWRERYARRVAGCPSIGEEANRLRTWKRPNLITREDLDGDSLDVQGISWEKLGTTRETAQTIRGMTYTNYTNLSRVGISKRALQLPLNESHFQFRQMDTRNLAFLSHFQLRNIISASSSNDVYFAGRSKALCADPSTGTERCIMDLSKPGADSFFSGPVKISTLTATHGVLIAGGFGGEYAMTSLAAPKGIKHVEGVVTDNDNAITNHVHTFLGRSNGQPNAVFSSNDNKIRVLDCHTNTFIKEHSYDWPVNCAATSPDGCLRVIVGDTTNVTVCNAETGSIIERLPGHRDYGFACAWADDGIHVATGNQDRQVNIWDARLWKHPLKTIRSEVAGVRALRFSPVGGGKRVLLMAEPADVVSVVDAESFDSMQKLDLFGEIGGISFIPDGSGFFVANTDKKFGGIMEYARIGYGQEYGMRYTRQHEIEDAGDEYKNELVHEWLPDEQLTEDKRVLRPGNNRKLRGLGLGNVLV